MKYYTTLHAANIVRQDLWNNPDKPLDLTYRTNELAGEAGEACNVLKKLEREARGMPGSRATTAQLAEELSDVVICVDLVAVGEALGPIATPQMPPAFMQDSRFDRTYRGNALALAVGRVCSVAHRVEENRRTEPSVQGRIGERDRLIRRLHQVLVITYWTAQCEGIDLTNAVADKFNATSRKVNLPVALCLNPGTIVQLAAGDTVDNVDAGAAAPSHIGEELVCCKSPYCECNAAQRDACDRKLRVRAARAAIPHVQYEYFKSTGKWYASGYGAPVPITGERLTRRALIDLNKGCLPGLSAPGNEYHEFTIVVLDPTSFPLMIPATE